MIKEVKTKENQTTQPANSNKKYVALALVAILAVIGIVMNNSSNEEETIAISTTEPEKVTTTAIEEQKSIEEPTVARIDITTPLVDADKPQFEVYVDGSETPARQARWMSKYNIQGYVVERNSGSIDIFIKVLNDSDIDVSLKGIWDRNANGKLIEHWVTYTVFTINNEPIITEPTNTWTNKPLTYVLEAEANDEYRVHIEWERK